MQNVQRALYAIINVFDWRDFDHTCFQELLTFSDWILREWRWSKKLSFPCVSYYLSTQTLHTCNRQKKFNSFMKSKWWRVLFKIFEREQQKTSVVQEPEFLSEKQFWNKTTFQKFQSCYVPSSAIPKIKSLQQTKLDVQLQQSAAFSETA